MHDEEWRRVDKFPLYEVSNQGRIRCGRKIVEKRSRAGRSYAIVKRGRRHHVRNIDILVATAFIRPVKPSERVVHRGGTADDNAANLVIISRRAHPRVAMDEAVRLRASGATYSSIRQATGVRRRNLIRELHRRCIPMKHQKGPASATGPFRTGSPGDGDE